MLLTSIFAELPISKINVKKSIYWTQNIILRSSKIPTSGRKIDRIALCKTKIIINKQKMIPGIIWNHGVSEKLTL